MGEVGALRDGRPEGHADAGGASRFFFVAKPARGERDAWCEERATTGGEATSRKDGSDGLSSPRAGAGRNGGAKNFHPTVKPVELMRHLVRLVTPPNGIVLEPFMGSGATGVAALLEGFRVVGMELSEDYARIASSRMEPAAPGQTSDDYFAGQMPLFGGSP